MAAAGLPLLLASGLLAGIEPLLVAAALAATLSTGFFLGSLSILASTQARSVRGALNLTFTLTLTWLILPEALAVLVPRGGETARDVYAWLGPLNAWIAATSPFALWLDALRGALAGGEALRARVVWLIGLQCLTGGLLAALAVAGLRASFRAQLGGRRCGRTERHVRARPACGDDPMLWKELLVPRVPAFYRPLGPGVVLILGGLLVWTATGLAVPAARELAAAGYGVAPAGSARAALHAYLRIVGTGVALVMLLGVASDAAAGLTSEREKDTWISLIATPLTGTQIIRAKILGAIGNTRYMAVVLMVLWMVGVGTGAVHPLGPVAAAVELAVLVVFTAALGTWISLRARHTMQALGRVMASLLVLFGGSFIAAVPVLGLRPLALAGSGPILLAASLASYAEVQGKPRAGAFGLVSDAAIAACWAGRAPEMALAWGLSGAGWALAAWLLARSACRRFDACHDRPPASTTEPDRGWRNRTSRVTMERGWPARSRPDPSHDELPDPASQVGRASRTRSR
jgi:hypothetical protein